MFTKPAHCIDKPTTWFASAHTQTQQNKGKQICRTCPALPECHHYVNKTNEKLNRQAAKQQNRPYQPNRDEHFQGIIAGQYRHATDGRGRKLNLQLLNQIGEKLCQQK